MIFSCQKFYRVSGCSKVGLKRSLLFVIKSLMIERSLCVDKIGMYVNYNSLFRTVLVQLGQEIKGV